MEDIYEQLHEAALRGKIENVKQLLVQGSNINQTDQNGNTSLHNAVKEDHINVAEYLIKKGADLEKTNADGQTPLNLAALLGRLKATKILLRHEANMDKEDKEGFSPLHSAIRNGHLDVIRFFIRQGAKVNMGNTTGKTPLFTATRYGKLHVVKYLISRGVNVNKEVVGDRTALHFAAQEGHLDVTKYLICQGAEVYERDNCGRTALHLAAQKGHFEVTKHLISQEADVNKGDSDGMTALHSAANKGHLDVTKYLISQGADVNRGVLDGSTALHFAAQEGHLNVTKYLISQEADVNMGDSDGKTALDFAAQKGHLDVTKYLISQGAEVRGEDYRGWTALHRAADKDHLDVTIYLIKQGAEVNKGNKEGTTALHFAAQKGHLAVTKYLISQGADVNKGVVDGGTALHFAAQEGHLDVTIYLISQGAKVNVGVNRGTTVLNCAARKGHLDITQYLISQGAEVNERDLEGRTALHLATQEGHLDVTKYLISQGAKVNVGDNRGTTVLHCAAKKGHLDITQYLISQGAKVNVGDNRGTTVLHCTAKKGHLDITQYLISQRAEVNERDLEGRTALHLAAQESHLDVTKFLISQGADVNTGFFQGRSALHFAYQEGHLDVTKYLISQGAELNVGDYWGRTVLHDAVEKGRLDITQYLISHGAKVNEGDNAGWTVLHDAAENGHLDVTEYLVSHGAQVNKGDNDGRTALHSAVQNGHLDVTKYLIGQGAEVNKGDNGGRTSLHDSVENGNINIVKVLLAGGASSDTVDIQGHTPLQLSSILGYQRIADLFIDCVNSKLVQEDLTDIHLALQHGHTSIIEKFVSEGADLNVQSTDGHICLHEAIKLCYKSVKNVQETDTLKKISDDNYKGELSPEHALVFYLLENGAKLDVKDETGNLPIQYAKDEVIKQMILSRLTSLEEIQSYRDEPSTPAIFSVEVERNTSAEIELEDHGVSLFIPPEAVHHNDPCKITLTLLRDPPSVDIQDDESVACYGIRCDPPNMTFHQPVKIRIPHSTLAINPEQLKPDIVSSVWDSVDDLPRTSRKRSSSSPEEPPYCRVYKRHLELYIGHCAEWWVLIPLEQQVIRHQLMCTPYIPDKIERGKEFEVHLQMHADLPGIETDIQEEKEQQLYHRSHPPVPFSVESKSGDVTVTCHREGEQVESKVLSLKDVYGKMRHNIFLSVTPTEDDVEFTGITITITQAGKLGVSRSIAFIIRNTDGQEYLSPVEPPSFLRAVEEVSKSELPDIDVLTIAQIMTVDQFYDLGVALGFTIQQLDVIEYRRFHDREQAIYDMLVKWRERQSSGQAAKETFLSLMESLESQAEEIAISDIEPKGEIPDKTLLTFARQIKPIKFYEIGGKLGFNKSELEHIEHRTLYNRNDANIQMLSCWKASQTLGPEAKQTLKLLWESVQDASNTEKTKDEEEEEEEDKVGVQELEVNSTTPPEQITEQSESEDMEIISNSDSEIKDGDTNGEDIDLRGGSPSTGEQCSVALPVKSLSSAWQLGKALRLDDDVIVVSFAPSDSAAMNRLARQLLNKWCRSLGGQEKKVLMTKLLQDYNIQDCNAGLDEISKKICTTPDLLDLSQRLDLTTSEILQVMSTSVSFPPTLIQQIVVQMLQEWVQQGGTRERLLEIAQAFHFNDAADKIATAMEDHPGFLDPFSHGVIDQDGGELKLDDLDIRVSIPAGAIPKGVRSVVTLSVPSRCSSKIPLQDGDVLITPVIACSFTQELLKPATVALPHCIHPEQHQDNLRVSLYTKLGLGTFGYRSLLPNTSRDFHISEDMVDFPTRHLQLWALSSSNVHGVQFTCEVLQPMFMLPSQKSTHRICIAHPCKRYPADMCRKQESLLEPFYQVATMIKFRLESKEDDLKLWCLSDSETVQETVPVSCLLNGEGNTSNFELLTACAEGGAKSICLRIEQGTSTLAEQQIPTSKEVEPDYGVSHTRGRIKFASDNMLKILSGLVRAIKDARDLGYQLGFSHLAVERYLDRADSSASSVSGSGFREMLRDWRRCVRPSEQVNKLRLALEEAGLSYTTEVLFHES